MIKNLVEKARTIVLRRPREQRANRVAPALSAKWERDHGVGQAWTPVSYGEYYPKSALLYTAIKVRQEAIAQVPWRVKQSAVGGESPRSSPSPHGRTGEAFGRFGSAAADEGRLRPPTDY